MRYETCQRGNPRDDGCVANDIWARTQVVMAQPGPATSPAPTPDAFPFRLLATDGDARRGEFRDTAHGACRNPGFHAGRHPSDGQRAHPRNGVRATGADIVLANTYHL